MVCTFWWFIFTVWTIGIAITIPRRWNTPTVGTLLKKKQFLIYNKKQTVQNKKKITLKWPLGQVLLAQYSPSSELSWQSSSSSHSHTRGIHFPLLQVNWFSEQVSLGQSASSSPWTGQSTTPLHRLVLGIHLKYQRGFIRKKKLYTTHTCWKLFKNLSWIVSFPLHLICVFIQVYWLQSLSSEPSKQSVSPSQISIGWIHRELLHWNCPGKQVNSGQCSGSSDPSAQSS